MDTGIGKHRRVLGIPHVHMENWHIRQYLEANSYFIIHYNLYIQGLVVLYFGVVVFSLCKIHIVHLLILIPWWRHQMETFSALLAICAGNSPVPGEFPAQRPVTRSCDVFFDLRPNKRLSKQSWGWWFETPSFPLCRHYNADCFTGTEAMEKHDAPVPAKLPWSYFWAIDHYQNHNKTQHSANRVHYSGYARYIMKIPSYSCPNTYHNTYRNHIHSRSL